MLWLLQPSTLISLLSPRSISRLRTPLRVLLSTADSNVVKHEAILPGECCVEYSHLLSFLKYTTSSTAGSSAIARTWLVVWDNRSSCQIHEQHNAIFFMINTLVYVQLRMWGCGRPRPAASPQIPELRISTCHFLTPHTPFRVNHPGYFGSLVRSIATCHSEQFSVITIVLAQCPSKICISSLVPRTTPHLHRAKGSCGVTFRYRESNPDLHGPSRSESVIW